VGGSLAAQTSSYASLVGTAQDRADTTLPGHAVLDLHAGVEIAQGWRVTLWGKNVGNRFYLTNAGRAYDTIIRYAGRPAEYGITVTRSWR
jgi:outer membrane receptor protein involved in Fe transport